MGCEFSINSNKLKAMTQFALRALANSEDAFVLFDVKPNALAMKTGCKGHWIEQLAKADVVTKGKILLPLEVLTSFKYSGKETLFKIKKSDDEEINDIYIKSGRCVVEVSVTSDEKVVLAHFPVKVSLTHKFNLTEFIVGLNQLSFEPIRAEGSVKKHEDKAIRIYVKNKKFNFCTQDNYRGSYFKSSILCEGKNFSLDANFDSIREVISLFSEEEKNKKDIEFGCNETYIRIKGKNIDYQSPLQPGQVMDVEEAIDDTMKTEPITSFSIKASSFREAFDEICGASTLEHVKEIPITMDIVKEKRQKVKKGEKAKPPKDLLYLIANSSALRVTFDIDVTNVAKPYKFYASNVIIEAAVQCDGSLHFYVFPKVIIIESLDYNMKFILPQLSEEEVLKYEQGKN